MIRGPVPCAAPVRPVGVQVSVPAVGGLRPPSAGALGREFFKTPPVAPGRRSHDGAVTDVDSN